MVGAVVSDVGRVLLLRRRAGDFLGDLWELPSGKVEEGETAPGGPCREAAEETGPVVLTEHDAPRRALPGDLPPVSDAVRELISR
ncbi:NUDIX domain-containing protein [Streptomyces sp. LaBMicrA B280]|uniref:NUDIX domain-containing protein n=1 Tax=Streptomyces sp. LaBMicrA B280 TaxID=3391001 RepID=UPI003BA67F21